MTLPPPLPGIESPVLPLGKRLSCLLAIVLVFIFVGPPIGAMVFMLAIAVIGMGMKVDFAGLTWVALFAAIYAVPLSYLIGVGPAAVGGMAVGVRQAFFGRITWPFAVLTGLGVGVGFLMLSGQPVLPRYDSDEPGYAPVMVVTCLAATFVCWAIVRNWYLDSIRTQRVTA